MVRILDSALTTALNNVSRVPSFKLTIEDHVIHYASYLTPGAADAWNDACIASDNSIIRVQVPVDCGIASERHRLCIGASTSLQRSDALFAREQQLLQWSSVENGHLFGCSKRESQAHL